MHSRSIAPLLIAFALVTVVLLLVGLFLTGLVVGPSLDGLAVEWLEAHGDEAERWAVTVLGGRAEDLPAAPPALETDVFPDGVVFTLSFGFKEPARGVCFSPTGAPPSLGFREYPTTAWTHIQDRWYAWEAECPP